jgi:hypothetical protein
MTYSSGQLIEDVDYNGFANNTAGANVNSIWGVGTGDAGYGQSTTLATVSDGTDITAPQWANLNNRISSIASQTNTTITSRTNPVFGDVIGILAALNTDLTNCTTNRGNAAASGTISDTWTGNIARTDATGSVQKGWTITFTHTVTFPSANQARYFFNAGGLIRLDMSKTVNSTDADADWNALVQSVGALFLSGRVNSADQTIGPAPNNVYTGFTRSGGTGTPDPNLTTTGWYSLASGGAATTMFQLAMSSSPYTGNYIRVTAAVNAGRTALTLVTTWVSSGSSGFGTSANISGGTDTASPYVSFGTAPAVLCRFIPPSTNFLTNTWGTPSIAATVTAVVAP